MQEQSKYQKYYRHTKEAAGFDLKTPKSAKIHSKQKYTVETDCIIKIPQGNIGIVYGRSGLTNKYSLEVDKNVIFSEKQEKAKMTFKNNSEAVFEFEKGDRIGQLVVIETGDFDLKVVDNF